MPLPNNKPKGAYFEAELIRSKALASLATTAAYVVFMELYLRRIMKTIKRGKKQEKVIENNGEILLTYTDAKRRWGYSPQRFKKALAELSNKGFIDIEHGGQMQGDSNKFTISNRWKQYDTNEYKPPAPAPPAINKGFKKGHKLGKNSKKI